MPGAEILAIASQIEINSCHVKGCKMPAFSHRSAAVSVGGEKL
jgi:hypothetical protein